MSDKKFSKDDTVYVIYDETIYRCLVVRSSSEWFDVSQTGRDRPQAIYGGSEPPILYNSRWRNRHGYASLAEAKADLINVLRANLAYKRRQVARTEGILTRLEAELS